MNREILFRGKRTDNGEWVEGFGVVLNTQHNVASIVKDNKSCWDFKLDVDPSTVGQYTGLKDSEGNKIFEGDVLGYDFFPNLNGVVVCRGSRFMQVVENINFCFFDTESIFHKTKTDIKVIGNVWDDEELLK